MGRWWAVDSVLANLSSLTGDGPVETRTAPLDDLPPCSRQETARMESVCPLNAPSGALSLLLAALATQRHAEARKWTGMLGRRLAPAWNWSGPGVSMAVSSEGIDPPTSATPCVTRVKDAGYVGAVAAAKREGEDGMGGGAASLARGGALLFVASFLASCAAAATAPTYTPRSPVAPIPTPNQPDPQAKAVPNAADWPQQDTPFAQASAQLQQAWAAYGVTIIPSRHVFDNVPPVPTVLNKTNGALTQAQAQQMGLAYYRTDALWGWADAHDQTKLQLYLFNPGFLNTPAGQAEVAGQPVQDPPCALFPSGVAVSPVDASVKAFEAESGYTVSSMYALVENYKTPCAITAITASGPKTIANWAFGWSINLETGSVRDDPVLGLAYFAEADRACPQSGYPTAPPGETLPPGVVPSPGSPDGGPLACGAFGA